MAGLQQQAQSMHSSVATEVSLKAPSTGPSALAPAVLQSSPQFQPQGQGYQQGAQVQPFTERMSGMSGISQTLDGPGPPLLPSSDTQAQFATPREARTARRRLDVSLPTARASLNTMNSPARSVAQSPGPSVLGSDQGGHARMSRIAARAMARGSMRDSGSERSGSKAIKSGHDVYRDDRGRRVERPKVVKSDVHMIGEIVGASGFPHCRSALFCRYRLVYDGTKSWVLARGLEAGCTQVSSPEDRDDDYVVWEHPLDVHMTTQKLEGWPSLLLMVYSRDDSAVKDSFVSYALCPLPNTPGIHHLTLRTWYPVESRKLNVRNIFAHYVGMAPRLDDDLADMGFATDVRMREVAGPHIASVGSGCVHVRLQMLFRHMSGLTRQMGDNLWKSLETFQMHLEDGRKKEMHRMAAMAEHQEGQKRPAMSEGLKQLREGRAAKFDQAQRAIDSRRSVTPSEQGSVYGDARRRSELGGRTSGTMSAPRLRRDSNMAGQGLKPEPSGGSAQSGVPTGQGTLADMAGAPSSRRPSGTGFEEGLGDRQAERDRRRQVAGPGLR